MRYKILTSKKAPSGPCYGFDVDKPSFEFFNVGRGYIKYWAHESTHWKVEAKLRYAVQELKESFYRLITQRDKVHQARRAFLDVSTIPSFDEPTGEMKSALFDAVHDFYQTYYSTLSSLSSLFTRFRDILGEVPHRSNEKFLDWLEPRALGGNEVISLLRSAREYRTLLDHKASHQPYDWATMRFGDAPVVIALHGPASQSGTFPKGAAAIESFELIPSFLPETSDWMMIAPDEDKVLTGLALQLNAVFPILSAKLTDRDVLRACQWKLELGQGDPQQGYPIFAAVSGRVAFTKPQFEPGASFGL